MSICSLRGSQLQLCRRAFILSSCSRPAAFQPVAATKKLTTREAHSALYQMVKKQQKIENKNQASSRKYPRSFEGSSSPEDCSIRSQNSRKTKFLNECAIPSSSMPPSSPSLPRDPVERVYNVQNKPQENYNELCRPRLSCNTEVLRAVNCNVSRKASNESKETSACDKSESGTSTGTPGGDKGDDKTKTILLALAGALGVGGLIYYFMNDKSNTTTSTTPEISKPNSSDLPKHVPYLLIGGGTASFSAFRAIKSNDAKAKVLMITDENHKPYMRPPLSKELWYTAQKGEISNDYRFKQWTGAERSLYFEPEEFFIEPSKLSDSENGGIAVAQGFKVKKVDPTNRVITLSDGYEITYDQCLIATGCTPKNLPIFTEAPPGVREKVMVYRTPEDFEKLKKYLDNKKTVAIIGNGFLGSELSCSLANYNKSKTDSGRIYQIFQETANMSKILPDYLSKWTMEKVKAQGVCVVPGASLKSVQRDNSHLNLALTTGETIMADVVVVCVGCEANTEIANGSGLEVDQNLGGFVVNAELEARRNLFVAGDASCFYDPLLGRRRVEHHDHSVVSGRLAGENMVGKKKPYAHQSMFWSDLGPEIGYEGIGLIDSSLPTVGVFALATKTERQTDNLTESSKDETEQAKTTTPSQDVSDVKCKEEQADNYGRGVVFYLRDEKIVGILLWNIFNRIGLARTIIKENKKYEDLNEVAKLFEIHS